MKGPIDKENIVNDKVNDNVNDDVNDNVNGNVNGNVNDNDSVEQVKKKLKSTILGLTAGEQKKLIKKVGPQTSSTRGILPNFKLSPTVGNNKTSYYPKSSTEMYNLGSRPPLHKDETRKYVEYNINNGKVFSFENSSKVSLGKPSQKFIIDQLDGIICKFTSIIIFSNTIIINILI